MLDRLTLATAATVFSVLVTSARADAPAYPWKTEKAPWGGYGGLGFRAAKTMREFRAIDSEGRLGRQQAHGKQAAWMDFSGVFGERGEKSTPAGIAIFDHPSKPLPAGQWTYGDYRGVPGVLRIHRESAQDIRIERTIPNE